jgi:outer membrane protein assembly factor BamA
LRELDATLTDPTGKHSIGYSLSWRNLRPIKLTNSLFGTVTSPEVLANCDSSLKSSVNYTFNENKMNDLRAPTAGMKTLFRGELAGAGGDVNFVKASYFGTFAASLLRFAPDTGYTLPETKREKENLLNTQSTVDDILRPHPYGEIFNIWGRAASGHVRRADAPIFVTTGPIRRPNIPGNEGLTSNSNRSSTFSMLDRLAGWLSPGITGILDVSLGGIIPFGNSAKQSENTRTRLPDRFFLQGTKCRGFDNIGPRAKQISGGSFIGDSLGGDILASLSARILLPPPIPSVTVSNYGVRSQFFATAANLSSLSSPVRLNARAGVGLYVPVVAGAALEANYALWHYEDKLVDGVGLGNPKATFRVQLSG